LLDALPKATKPAAALRAQVDLFNAIGLAPVFVPGFVSGAALGEILRLGDGAFLKWSYSESRW
jgi:hypothetical protein